MRLTLRTLLAYLDDRLSPSNAKEIGQKIANSPFASELAERIRDVVRRRRLATPEKQQAAIEPNLVAEYLDDQLTPDLVARIEQEILRSDAALAEVAATHEILGLLRDPVELETRLRDRLYAMDPSGRLATVQLLAEKPGIEAKPAAFAPSGVPEWKPLETRTSSSRQLPLIFVSVLALVWLFVIYQDLFRRHDQTAGKFETPGETQIAAADVQKPGPGDAALRADDAAVPAADSSVPVLDEGSGAKTKVSATAPDPGVASTPDAAADPKSDTPEQHAAPNPAAPDSNPPDTSAVSETTDDADVASESAEIAAANEKNHSEKHADDQVISEPNSGSGENTVAAVESNPSVYRIFLVDEYRTALLLDEAGTDWTLAASHADAGVGAEQLTLFDWRPTLKTHWLGVSAPFRVRISPDGAGWNADIAGNAICRVINSQEAGISLLEGQMIVTRDPAVTVAAGNDGDKEKAAADRIPFTLQAGRSTAIIRLLTPDTRVAIEVQIQSAPLDTAEPVNEANPADPDGAETEADGQSAPPARILPPQLLLAADRLVRLYVAEGQVELQPALSEEPVSLNKAATLTWKVLSDGETLAVPGEKRPVASLPDWVYKSGAETLPELRNVMSHVSDNLIKGDNFQGQMLTLTGDRNSQAGVAATNVFAVTRNVDMLMTTLLQSQDEAVRRAAIDGLQRISVQTSAGRNQLHQILETRLPMSDVDIMERLIRGLPEADARNRAVCAGLLALLSNERPALRELAFYRMETVAGDRFGYHAEADSGRRREAVKRWQRYLDRNNGQLLP